MSEKHQDLISKIEALTVVELAELVKTLEEKFGISAAAAADKFSASEVLNTTFRIFPSTRIFKVIPSVKEYGSAPLHVTLAWVAYGP